MIKIPFGQESAPAEAPEMPAEGMPEEEHDVHMEEMKAGLQQILSSSDIGEIKTIAQGLLGAEENEASAEGMGSKESLNSEVDKILAK